MTRRRPGEEYPIMADPTAPQGLANQAAPIQGAASESPAPQSTAPEVAKPEAPARPPVVVKKYANRRLYNTETSSYVTLEDLAGMVRLGRDFTVSDAKSGEDITRSVLTQIIVEEESKGQNLLPIPFLRQLIGLYGHSLQSVVPRYLEATMGAFARQQEGMRRAAQDAMGGAMGGALGGTMGGTMGPALGSAMGGFNAFAPFEEIGKQNMAMLERAMSLFSPFPRGAAGTPQAVQPTDPADDLESMREELAALRQELATLRQGGAG
jgi:polyhydroxyalkanoate synthesis repressor PhaR